MQIAGTFSCQQRGQPFNDPRANPKGSEGDLLRKGTERKSK